MRFSLAMRCLLLFVAPAVIALAGCDKPAAVIAEEPPHLAPTPPTPSSAPIPSEPRAPEPGGVKRAPRALPIIREVAEIVVEGVSEQWRLEWTEEPTRACFDDQWATCPCYGFAFGETGDFDLVRARPGAPEDRLHLSGTLQRWPVIESDSQRWIGGTVDADEITRRPEVKLIRFGDYDHDGRATEFVLQIGAGSPCVRQWSEIVGIDRRNGKLHAFGTAAHPDKALVLEYRSDWEQVKKSLVAEVTEIGCGDHGSGRLVTDVVRSSPHGFDVEVRAYDCVMVNDPKIYARRGKLLERRPWSPDDAFPFE